jgi:hypothetical protein
LSEKQENEVFSSIWQDSSLTIVFDLSLSQLLSESIWVTSPMLSLLLVEYESTFVAVTSFETCKFTGFLNARIVH